MRFVTRKDEFGNAIGADVLDDNGNVINSVSTPEGEQQGYQPPLPGQPLPGQTSLGDYSSDTEIRSREASQRAASRAGGSSSEEDTGGYYSPPQSQTDAPPAEQMIASAPAESDPYRGSENSPARRANEARQESLQQDVAQGRGPLRGFGARLRLGLGAAVYGAADAIDDATDFGAAVIDQIRGVETDDNDNTLNVVGRLAQPDSQLGRAGSELVSFGVSSVAVGAAIAAGAAASIPGFAIMAGTGAAGAAAGAATRFGLGAVAAAAVGGVTRTVVGGAVAGAITDFVKAKEGEENLYNALKGTPLETPVSRFLAADTDEDSNLFMEKVKAAVGGVPLGIAFDLLGVGAKSALKNYRVAPVETYLKGLKKAKGALPGEQPKLMLKAAEDTATVLQQAQESLRNELKIESNKSITETRRLLKGQLDGTEEQGLINAELSTPGLSTLDELTPEIRYQEQLEEQMLKAEDLRTALSGVEDPNVNKEALDELDASIFDIQDKLDELSVKPEVDEDITRVISPFDDADTTARRGQLTAELAEIEARLSLPQENTTSVVDDLDNPKLAEGELEDLTAAKSEIQSQLDELNTVPQPRDVSPFTGDQGAGSEVPVTRIDEPDASLGTRKANIIGGEGVGRVEDVGNRPAPESLNQRQPQPYQNAYKARSKTQIRQTVAAKAVDNRVTTSAEPVFKADVFKSSLEGGSDIPSGRFINTDKLTDAEAVRDTIKQVMSSLPNHSITDDITETQILKSAQDVVAGIRTLDDADGRAAMLAYGSSVGNLQVSNVAARLMVKDLADQVVSAATPIRLGKAVIDKSTSEVINDLDVLHKMSRLSHYLVLNKNLGKITSQGLRMRGIDISDVNMTQTIKQAEYDEMFTKASKETQTADDIFSRMKELYQDPTKRKDFDRLMNSIQNSHTPDEVVEASKLAKFMVSSRKYSKFLQGMRMNNILSGSTSNSTNITSNLAQTLYVPLTQLSGSILDAGFQIMRGDKAAVAVDKSVMIQTIGQLTSLNQHLSDSIRMATKTLRTGKNNLEPSKLFDDPDAFDMLDPNSGPVLNGIAKILSLSLRFMASGDELFKQLNYRSFVHGKAFEQGMKQGLRGKKLNEYALSMVSNSLHNDETHGIKGLGLDKEGVEYARFVTFQNEINADTSRLRHGLVDIVETLRRSPIPGVPTMASLFVPFIKTPSNVMAYTARNTPLAFVSKEWQNDFAAGGAKKARALGEFAMGSTMLMGVFGLGQKGLLVGKAPIDPEERALFYENGGQEYSIKLPGTNKAISFKRMEPFAGHLSMVSDVMQANQRRNNGDEDEWQNSVLAATLISFVASAKNRTFFEGFSQLIETIDGATSADSKGYNKVGNVFTNIATTLIPYSSAFNEQRKARDMTLREANTVVEKFMNKLPGMSDDLPSKRSWLTGKPQQYQSNPVFNLYPTATLKNDPLINNLIKFNVAISPPSEDIKGVKLSGEQYSEYNRLTGTIQIDGKTLYQSLSETFNSFDKTKLEDELEYIQNNDEYASSTPLAVALGKVRTRYREAADSMMVQTYPELFSQIQQKLIEKGNTKQSMFYLNDPLGSNMGYEVDESDPKFIEQTEEVRTSVNKTLRDMVENPGTRSSGPLDVLQ